MSYVEVKTLSKTYSDGTRALKSVSFNLDECVTFIVGPNGAGKTTLVKILSSQLRKSEGKVNIFGYDLEEERERIKNKIAIVPQEATPKGGLTPFEHLYYYLLSRGISRKEAKDRTKRTLNQLDLWKFKDKLASELSGGYKRRLLTAMAIAVKAELTILDEPTIGFDPIVRRKMWETLESLFKGSNRKGLITTHYMEEVENNGDYVLILNQGKLIKKGPPSRLLKEIGFQKKVLVPQEANLDFAQDYIEVYSDGKRKAIFCKPEKLSELINNLPPSIRVEPITMEDVFITVVKNVNAEN